jgi:hypothetical protein
VTKKVGRILVTLVLILALYRGFMGLLYPKGYRPKATPARVDAGPLDPPGAQ